MSPSTTPDTRNDTCTGFATDETGRVTEIHCTYDPDTAGGQAPDGRKLPLTVGMQVSAEIHQGRRTVLAYLLATTALVVGAGPAGLEAALVQAATPMRLRDAAVFCDTLLRLSAA